MLPQGPLPQSNRRGLRIVVAPHRRELQPVRGAAEEQRSSILVAPLWRESYPARPSAESLLAAVARIVIGGRSGSLEPGMDRRR